MSKEKTMVNQSLDEVRQSLAARMSHMASRAEEVKLPIPGMEFHRYTKPTVPVSALHKPSICLVVQGAKRVQLNDEVYTYDDNHFLFTSVTLPIIANITEASPEVPFLGITWELDLGMVAQLVADSRPPARDNERTESGVTLGAVTGDLLNLYIRAMDLLGTPEDIPFIAPLIHKELLYRLLKGDQGGRLRQISMDESHSLQISKAIDWLTAHYNEPVRMEDVAAQAGMSMSGFNKHFRSVTAMSPLQFQKWTRLQEARRLMLAENKDAASAAGLVGYDSPSQFSREYSRQFGAPPKRDIKLLQEMSE